jgi:hypothetical protein
MMKRMALSSVPGAFARSASNWTLSCSSVVDSGLTRQLRICGSACPTNEAGILSSACKTWSAMYPLVTASITLRTMRGTANCESVAMIRNKYGSAACCL